MISCTVYLAGYIYFIAHSKNTSQVVLLLSSVNNNMWIDGLPLNHSFCIVGRCIAMTYAWIHRYSGTLRVKSH